MTLIEYARKLRPLIEKAAKSLADEDALEAIQLYPHWSGDNVDYSIGDRLQYNGVLYRVLQPHTSQPNWHPDAAASLFAKVLIPGDDIPEWEQPDSTNGYNVGDKVKYKGKIWESRINNNVWSPDAYPAGWSEVSV